MNATATLDPTPAPAKRPPGRPRLHPLPDPARVPLKRGPKPVHASTAARQKAWRDKKAQAGLHAVYVWAPRYIELSERQRELIAEIVRTGA